MGSYLQMKWTILWIILAISVIEEAKSDSTHFQTWSDAKHRPLYLSAIGSGRPSRPSQQEWSGSEVVHECNCGIRNRNVNSEDDIVAHVGEIPWRCYLDHSKLNGFCGASIISSNWVITTSNCFERFDKDDALDFGSGVTVICGDHDRSSIKEVSHVTVNADKIILHEEYIKDNRTHDIALIRLAQRLTWTNNIRPVCLPFAGEGWDCEVKDTGVLASGWTFGMNDKVLQKSRIPCLDRKKCREILKKENQEDRLADSKICTHKTNSDSCPGDLGSSVDFEGLNGRYYAIGIASHGGCQDMPAISTRVTEYLNWIKRKTDGERFCGDERLLK